MQDFADSTKKMVTYIQYRGKATCLFFLKLTADILVQLFLHLWYWQELEPLDDVVIHDRHKPRDFALIGMLSPYTTSIQFLQSLFKDAFYLKGEVAD